MPPPWTGAGNYRYQQQYLFQAAQAAVYPSRLAGGTALGGDTVGPTWQFVSAASMWPWDRLGGDWVDAGGVRHGTRPWASVPATRPAPALYDMEVTALVATCFTQKRWTAILLTCGAPRNIVALGHPTHAPPVIEVRYRDGTTGTLWCRLCAGISNGSLMPNTTAKVMNAPVMLEFDRPSKEVASATLKFTNLATFWGNDAVFRVWLLDPPVNRAAVRPGVAAGAPLDAALAAHPSIIGTHRLPDGIKLDEIAVTDWNPNFNAVPAYSPDLYGRGAKDETLLPYRGAGKWITVHEKDWSIVPSTYRAEGFEPLAPGVAALRVLREREVTRDGEVVGYGLNRAVNAKLFMPPEHFGTLDEIYVRYYVRLGTADGRPYIHDNRTRYQVYKSAGSAPVWTDCAGKAMIMPAHDTTPGGVSGSSGGGRGWQMRMGWNDVDLPSGPDTGGWVLAPHMWDFQYANPPGHRYGIGDLPQRDRGLGQQGGLGGVVYAHKWYCLETRLKLNSVDKPAVLADGTPHVVNGVRQYWTPDGVLEYWIDGRLAYSKTGMVFRSAPIYRTNYAGREDIYLPPTGDLGIRDLWFNWYHGGVTKSSRSRVQFITGLAWGTQYIGPMTMP